MSDYREVVYSIPASYDPCNDPDYDYFRDQYITPFLMADVRFTPVDQAAPEAVNPEEQLWGEAFRAAEISVDVQSNLSALYEAINAKKMSTSYFDYQKADELEADYWEQFKRLQELKAVEADLLRLLEQYEQGEISQEELAEYLPSNEEEETLDKRNQAIERSRQNHTERSFTSMELFMLGYGFDYRSFARRSEPGTDPRRLATGRNLTKLVARHGLGAYEAQGKYFEVTADTHGGKSRRPGKSATHYVSKSGKRIRKR